MATAGQARNPIATERLMAYWAEGKGAALIDWGVPGDFDRCRVHLGEHVPRPDELAGLCANLHHRALGVWPGQEDGGKPSTGQQHAMRTQAQQAIQHLPDPK